jgi:hypothetical protein
MNILTSAYITVSEDVSAHNPMKWFASNFILENITIFFRYIPILENFSLLGYSERVNRTARYYIPEDRSLLSYRFKNLKSSIPNLVKVEQKVRTLHQGLLSSSAHTTSAI